MEYTDKERKALSLLGRTDFKNLSKTDVLSFVSMLGELRPEVATHALAQFPEFASLVRSSFNDYSKMIGKMISNDDDSIHQVYGLSSQELQAVETSKKQFFDLANHVYTDLNKCLHSESLSIDEKKEICSQEIEILKLVAEKDTNMRSQQREIVREAHQKDSEKRQFNWKLVGGISAALVFFTGVGAGLLGGKFDLHLPKKS